MESRVIVRRAVNATPDQEINEAIGDLGPGWRVTSAETNLAVYGYVPGSEHDASQILGARGGIHHCVYVTTVVMQKD